MWRKKCWRLTDGQTDWQMDRLRLTHRLTKWLLSVKAPLSPSPSPSCNQRLICRLSSDIATPQTFTPLQFIHFTINNKKQYTVLVYTVYCSTRTASLDAMATTTAEVIFLLDQHQFNTCLRNCRLKTQRG